MAPARHSCHDYFMSGAGSKANFNFLEMRTQQGLLALAPLCSGQLPEFGTRYTFIVAHEPGILEDMSDAPVKFMSRLPDQSDCNAFSHPAESRRVHNERPGHKMQNSVSYCKR